MMKILFTFPGQGAQTPHMLHQLPDNEITKKILATSSETLNEDVFKLDTKEALQKTRAVQLCILITGIVYANLLKDQGVNPDFTSGLSIGAFPAAVFAGALEFTDALKLVSLRGELMEKAYPQGYGLTSIQGLLQKKVESLVASVNCSQFPVYVANYNDEDQFVIAGSESAMLKVAELAKQNGARKTTKLAVSVPSHCDLLSEAAKQLAEAMEKVVFKNPRIHYLSGSTARAISQPNKIADDLAYNMSHPVHWHDAMVAAYERGARLAIEMPPGAVLTGLTKKVMEQGDAVSTCQNGLHNVVMLVKELSREQ